MIQTFENTKFGEVTVRNIVIDVDGTNLEEGINISVIGSEEYVELLGYQDIEDMTNEDVEEILFENL